MEINRRWNENKGCKACNVIFFLYYNFLFANSNWKQIKACQSFLCEDADIKLIKVKMNILKINCSRKEGDAYQTIRNFTITVNYFN